MTKFTRDACVGILKSINDLPDRKYNKYVLFALDKNRAKLITNYNTILEKEKELTDPKYKEFNDKRIATIKKYALLDENGDVVVENDNARINPSFIEEFGAEIENLTTEYSETITKNSESIKKLEEFVSESIEMDFVKISFKYIPEELDPKQYALLSLFVKETEEEITNLV